MTKSIIKPEFQALPPSKTLALNARAQALKAAGKDIINLTVGEPDLPTPAFVKEAAIRAIHDNLTRYTAVGGTPELKKAICHKFSRDNQLHFKPESVMAATGCKQILFNALMATLSEGDEVLIPSPYWVSYPDMVNILGGKPVIIDCAVEQGFILQPEVLEAHITPKTKWLILNYPSNPAGVGYSKAQLMALIEVLKRHPHVWVLADEIYEHITFPPNEFHSIAALDESLAPRVLTANGLSKSHAMTGWRIGFCGGDAELIKIMTNLQSQSTSNPCSITQAAAVAALEHDNLIVDTYRDVFKKRIEYIEGALANTNIKLFKPQGAFYLFVDVSAYMEDDNAFANALLEQAEIAVVPGSSFGVDGFVRLSCATAEDVLEMAMNRLIKFLDTLN